MTTCLRKSCSFVRIFRERLSVCMCASFLCGFEGGMWDLIVLIPDYCLSIYIVKSTFTYYDRHTFSMLNKTFIRSHMEVAIQTCNLYFKKDIYF